MASQNSKKGKGLYATYKTENKALKNKIKKLERHCKRFPKDEQGKVNLEKAYRGEYIPRSKPFAPRVKPTEPKIKYNPGLNSLFHIKTAGEQLSELLGIPVPIVRIKRKKPKTVITHKPRRK